MTDMRATERLLDFIAERSDDERVRAAIAELQRRGDTLVRGDDLALVLKYAGADPRLIPPAVGDDILAAITHLETAVGSG